MKICDSFFQHIKKSHKTENTVSEMNQSHLKSSQKKSTTEKSQLKKEMNRMGID